MTRTERVALAQRLGDVELELQRAVRGLDGSPEARMRLAQAREEHRAAETQALAALTSRAEPDDAANVAQYSPPGPLTLSFFVAETGT
ncbi:hypothetical protein [Corallococcus sp. 4LFB]|uniref:hypothetical protein n=1 Tax=Corallococcus sp. 4LFB TaxID=3383249 RepID=UPI003975A333